MENYIIAGCTDTGKLRSVNEDNMTTFDSVNGRVLVVCDGMGGQNAGDVASQLAVTVIQDILTDNAFETPEEAIKGAIMAANRAILHRSAQNAALGGMGATCVMLIIKDGQAYYGSVGDSRIYYVANQTIRQITKDQSYVQTLVDAGQITQEAAEHHQDKNQITNALGLEDMTPPVIGQSPITPEAGSVFVLCSDGLSGMINNNTILNTVSHYEMPLAERAKTLVQQANEAGGADNITVQLVEFPGGGGPAANGVFTPSRSTKKKGKKGGVILTVCLIMLVAALAVAGAGYYFGYLPWGEKQKPAEPTVERATKHAAPKAKRTAVPHEEQPVDDATFNEALEKPAPKSEAASQTKPEAKTNRPSVNSTDSKKADNVNALKKTANAKPEAATAAKDNAKKPANAAPPKTEEPNIIERINKEP